MHTCTRISQVNAKNNAAANVASGRRLSSTSSTRTTAMGADATPVRFTPLFNDAFLKIFGSADSAPVTQPMLNALLRAVGMPEVDRIDRISADSSLPGGVECKSPRLDVVVICDDGRLFDLEAQRQKVDIGAKSLFYAAKLLVENTPKGDDGSYGEVPRVVTIVLLEGSELLPGEEQFLSVCSMNWDVNGQAVGGPGNIAIIVAELDKVRARYNWGNIEEVLVDESLAWLYLLAAGYRDPGEVDKIVASFSTMEEFAKHYGIALGDPDLKRQYDRWWMSQMEYNSIVEQARKDGMKLGIEEGRELGMQQGIAQGVEQGIEQGIAQGIAQGIEQGVEQGIEQGIEQGVAQSIAALRAAGLDDAADLLERQASRAVD